MALERDVKNYVACWMQLGTKVWLQGGQASCQVKAVIAGEQYSSDFEACWRQVSAPESGDCYLDGTTVTLRDLTSDAWEIMHCARCDMPLAIPIAGLADAGCPCQGLANWPNTEIPIPHPPVESRNYLKNIQHRLCDQGGDCLN
ncbi:MAG: hypothetical protein WCD18_02000 [Thermosynechococcaceae cyanobacterium]